MPRWLTKAGEAAEEEAIRQEIRQGACKAFSVPPRIIGLEPDLLRRVRLRLWLHRCVDEAAYWLVCHDHCTAARRLWQICGMW